MDAVVSLHELRILSVKWLKLQRRITKWPVPPGLSGGLELAEASWPGGRGLASGTNRFIHNVHTPPGKSDRSRNSLLPVHLLAGRSPTVDELDYPKNPSRGVARRLELLREAVSLPKFAPFVDRMVVFVDPAYVDEAFAALWDSPACCVAELADLLQAEPLRGPPCENFLLS